MIRTYFIIRLSILLIFAGIIAGGVSNGKWLSVGPAEAGNSAAPFEPAIDGGSGNEISMPPGEPKPGYQWVLRRITTHKTTIVQDGYKLERKPRYIEKYRHIGSTERKVAVYNTVTENEGWEYYTVEIPVYKTVSYIKEYKPVAIFRNGVFVGAEKQPVYGSKRIQIGTRKETRRRPHWVTRQEFSHWKIVNEPKYGWEMEQDGWEEPELVPNFVSRTVPSTTWVWRQEPLPWQPGTTPDWLPEPDWLTSSARPPWISAALWERLPLQERHAILREARGAWEKVIKEQISSDGTLSNSMPRELFETLRLWEDFPREMWVTPTEGVYVRDMPSAYSGMKIGALEFRKNDIEWTGKIHFAQEEGRLWYQISYISVTGPITGWIPGKYLAEYAASGPNDEEPLEPSRKTYGYHDGKDAWSHYLNPDSSAAQYLKLVYLFAAVGDENYQEYTDDYFNPHHNLCGELAVMEAVGISLEEGLKKFRDTVSAEILKDVGAGTSPDNLTAFFVELGWNSNHNEDDNSGTRLREEVSNGHSTLALVTIDNQQGQIGANGNTAHWVGIKAIADGEVRIYNPFTNKIETYDWEDFRSAWAQTPGNDSRYRFITGEQPDGQ
jgi:hypothetical protein